jgi:glycosyltransferase involved in cell wall biosynthesis
LTIGATVLELRHVLRAYEAAVDFDVIHDHTMLGPILAAGRPQRAVVVTTSHSPFVERFREIYCAMSGSVPIIAISCAQASSARGIDIAEVIHHGIDLDAFPLGRGDGGYYLYLGRMAPYKGALQAALVARTADVRLLIAAKMRSDLERDFFAEQVAPVLGGGVEFVGEVTAHERLELLQGARALLNPISWPEPFGLVMIEALSCGTPVLAFAAGAAPEIIDHGTTGYVCADQAEMVRYLQRVDELDRGACRAAAEARFSTARMVESHLRLYERLLSQRRRDQVPDRTISGRRASLVALKVAGSRQAEVQGLAPMAGPALAARSSTGRHGPRPSTT